MVGVALERAVLLGIVTISYRVRSHPRLADLAAGFLTGYCLLLRKEKNSFVSIRQSTKPVLLITFFLLLFDFIFEDFLDQVLSYF